MQPLAEHQPIAWNEADEHRIESPDLGTRRSRRVSTTELHEKVVCNRERGGGEGEEGGGGTLSDGNTGSSSAGRAAICTGLQVGGRSLPGRLAAAREASKEVRHKTAAASRLPQPASTVAAAKGDRRPAYFVKGGLPPGGPMEQAL